MHYPDRMRRACILLAGSLTLACGSGAPLTGSDAGSDTTATGTGSTGATVATDTTGTGGEPTTSGATGGASETGMTEPLTGGAQSTSGTGTSTGAQTVTGETGPGETDGTGDTGETGETGVVDACPCPDLVVGLDDGIFVLSKTAVLWKYFPGKNEMQMLGVVDCGLPPSTFSMGVDREGFAWVQFSDKQIRKVDITKVSECSDPGFVPGQDNIGNFGMAFVSNSADDPCDRLHGNHYNFKPEGDKVAEFFSVDPDTLTLVQLGKSDYGLAEVFTMTDPGVHDADLGVHDADPGVHDADPGVHDADLAVHDGPIPAFTMDRFSHRRACPRRHAGGRPRAAGLGAAAVGDPADAGRHLAGGRAEPRRRDGRAVGHAHAAEPRRRIAARHGSASRLSRITAGAAGSVRGPRRAAPMYRYKTTDIGRPRAGPIPRGRRGSGRRRGWR